MDSVVKEELLDEIVSCNPAPAGSAFAYSESFPIHTGARCATVGRGDRALDQLPLAAAGHSAAGQQPALAGQLLGLLGTGQPVHRGPYVFLGRGIFSNKKKTAECLPFPPPPISLPKCTQRKSTALWARRRGHSRRRGCARTAACRPRWWRWRHRPLGRLRRGIGPGSRRQRRLSHTTAVKHNQIKSTKAHQLI